MISLSIMAIFSRIHLQLISLSLANKKLLFSCFYLLCFIPTAVSANPENKPLTEINVQLKWRHQFQFAGYYAALEKGYYRDVGLKVNLLERLPGPPPLENLMLGNAEYAIGGVGALIYRSNGVPLVALAAMFQHSPSILISRYKDINDLRNKKIMLSRGVMNAEITSMLKQAGLDLSTLNIVPSNQSLYGYIAGIHDAYNAYSTNEIYQLEQKNVPYYSFKPRDYGVDFYGDILYTNKNRVDFELEQVKNFRAASIKGWQYALEHQDEIIALILHKYNSQNKSKPQLAMEAKELAELTYSNIVPIGYMSEQRWQSIAEVLQSTGDIKSARINLDDFLFDQYIKDDLSKTLQRNVKEIIAFIVILITSALILHNYRLKIKIKDRTKQLNQAKQRAEHEARTDSLTSLANRRYFMEVVLHDISIARRNDLALSVIYIDIDWFKEINDKFGHAAGDLALKSLAEILKRNIRASDTPARIGGEEFVVVCLGKDKDDAITLAERIRTDVEKSAFTYQNHTFSMTVSLGVASAITDESLEQVLKKADSALYKAKESGRNQVQSI